MNSMDGKLERLFTMARPGIDPPRREAPPWFARRVVRLWLSANAESASQTSWRRVTRCGLGLAGAAMVASLALNWRVWWHADSPEQLASESVVWLALPK